MAFHAILALVTLGLAALLGVVSLLAAWRTSSMRFGFAGAAFLLVAARTLLFVLGQEGSIAADVVPGSVTSVVMDTLVIILLYVAIVKE